MTNKKRSLALIAALVICIFMMFSYAFMISSSDHECTGEDCSICYQIHKCEKDLETLSLAVKSIALAIALAYCSVVALFYFDVTCETQTPITLKVKLSN